MTEDGRGRGRERAPPPPPGPGLAARPASGAAGPMEDLRRQLDSWFEHEQQQQTGTPTSDRLHQPSHSADASTLASARGLFAGDARERHDHSTRDNLDVQDLDFPPLRSPAIEPDEPFLESRPSTSIRFSLEDEYNRGGFGSGTPHVEERGRSHHPRLELDTNLYTIPSATDDMYRRRSYRADMPEDSTEPGATSQSGVRGDDALGHDGAGIVASPVSLTGHRMSAQGYNGLDGKMKHAIANLAETNVTLENYRQWVQRQRERRRQWASGPLGRIRLRIDAAYRHYILEGLLRQKPLPPSADGRRIPLRPGRARRKPFIDERTGNPYVSNFIRSSRYTVYDFLPKQLIFQFSRLANFYFLTISIMQMIPGLSTTGTYTTIIPLIIFVAISMAKEGYDDYRRYKLDKLENRSAVSVLNPEHADGDRSSDKATKWTLFRGRPKPARQDTEMSMHELDVQRVASQDESQMWSTITWQQLRVGDIVKLQRDESVPADLVLLSATGPDGVAYIETMALDGETNLKSKQAPSALAKHCGSVADMASSNIEIISEDPNLDLYNYEGRATVDGVTTPLTLNQVIYRGSVLRNTTEAIGLVINSGEECKIRMNATKNVRAKAPAMQHRVNRIVILLVILVVMLSVGCSIGNAMWNTDYERRAWYLRQAHVPFKEILVGFIIEFNTLIPLSLYVSMEIIKLGQLLLLQDVNMYDARTDTPMVANTTTILEDLGQISYVFSDKTGTLTENMMKFRKMTVAGTAWLHDMDVKREAKVAEALAETQRQASVRKASRRSGSLTRRIGSIAVDRTSFEGVVPNKPPQRQDSRASTWTASGRPDHVQPELNTVDLIEYLRRRPNTAFSKKARQFLLCMALCHTCLPEKQDDGRITFQAASPDELALVEAAQELGYTLIERSADFVTLQFLDSHGTLVTEKFQVLDVIEFSSKRKRMSIIIRLPGGKLYIFTKGADTVILPRLKLNHLAIQKASFIERRATIRKSIEQEAALRRRESVGLVASPVQSLRQQAFAQSPLSRRMSSRRKDSAGRASSVARSISGDRRNTATDAHGRPVSADFDHLMLSANAESSEQSTGLSSQPLFSDAGLYDGLVDEALAVNEGAIFERCFQQINDFASEGLRTLLFAYRLLDEVQYTAWKKEYHSATTSLVDRQAKIEAAAEIIEQDFDLAGATAIEDKLQEGVPDTIDKLRRANIHVWMLTGDKRETAINIAHSARICQPFSEIYILDATENDLQQTIAATLVDVSRKHRPHSVVVIDGHTLSVVEDDETLKGIFFDLTTRVDSVICCRASPSQKATLVKSIRLSASDKLTLAIGDGANDIAMIQAAHVGIGISGREGLQAARIADFSIAQFRFLQRLLFVHGRWNYIRTGKYILGTFWKEIVFYLVQAQYQRQNGYTGTSLYESASLTVFNTLFTSLPVILLGIFEKDLSATTLLAWPELYTFGQKNRGFSYGKYFAWMFMGVTESLIIFNAILQIYMNSLFTADTTLFAMGSLAFTVCVVFINLKML
jgi:phospholipid-translocating ATPase